MLLNASASVGGASTMGGGGGLSPPPPAPSSSSPIGSGVIVQVGPGSSSSTSSTISTPTSLLTSPVTTPPTPAPSTTSIPLGSLFGVNPLTFPAFSSNVTLTSNHARAGSQDAAFVPNSSSTNIMLPVVPCSAAGGLAPLAILSSPSLGSTSNSGFSSPTSPTSGGGTQSACGIVSIDVANPSSVASSATTKTTAGASSLLLPSSSSLLPSCVISNLATSSNTNNNFTTSPSSSSTFPVIHSCHMNSNAISTSTCSLNQSIAAGGIIGVSHGTGNVVTTIGKVGGISEPPPPGPPQHCLLVSCNPTSPSVSSAVNNNNNSSSSNQNTSTNLISTEAQTDNNNEGSSTIAIAPPPPSRSREHRKRERRERRRDRSYRGSSHRTSTSGGGCSNTGSSGGGQGHSSSSSSYHNHHHHHHGNGSSSGTTSRHHHHHHRVKNSGVASSSSFNSGNASSSSVLQQSSNSTSYSNPSSSASNIIGSTNSNNNNNTSCATTSTADDLISGIQSTGDDQLSVVSHLPPPSSENGTLILGPPPSSPLGIAGMPDLLDSHLPPAPPPYSTLPHSHPHAHHHPHVHSHVHPPPHPPPQHLTMGNAPVPIPLLSSPVPVSLMPAPPPTLISPPTCIPPQPVRYHFSAATRQSRRSMRAHRGVPYASEEEPKTCCGMSASQAVSIRWFIIVIAVIGICCTLAGTALGAARSAGKEHLTLSLLMIGVGVLLLTVSAVAWRLTANESGTSCRAMLGFARAGSSRGDGGSEPNRRFVPRLPPTYGRPHHPYAAMMYPEFQYRPPPPSYQASMQEYRLRLLLLERSNPTIAALGSSLGHGPVTMVPPPPYRPYSANMRMLPHARVDEYSRPPSYRSRSSGNHNGDYDAAGSRPSLDPSVGHNHSHHHIIESPMHSRDPSLLSYLSQQSVDNMSVVSGHVANLQTVGNPATTTATVVTVVQAVSVGMDIGLGSTLYDEDGKGLPSLEDDKGYDPERDNKDGNLVRIVQTTDSSQVIGRDSVIVTVSGGGSNTSLWDTYHHHHLSHQTATAAGYVAQVHTSSSGTPNNNNIVSCNNGGTGSNSNVITMSDRSSSVGDQGEVQILAHL